MSFFFSVTSERHKVINDICSIFLIGDFFSLFLIFIPPAIFLFFTELICNKLGYYDFYTQFGPFIIVFWHLLLVYSGIKVRLFFIPSWITISIVFLVGNFYDGNGRNIKWTLVSAVYTLVGLVVLWILSKRKKKVMEKVDVKKPEITVSQLSEPGEEDTES